MRIYFGILVQAHGKPGMDLLNYLSQKTRGYWDGQLDFVVVVCFFLFFVLFYFALFCFSILEITARASLMLGKCFITQL
jgi:hypothetical protein